MTDYVKSTNFASKDSLSSGNPLKIVKGTEIDTEFNNIATAVATKADLNGPTFIGVPAAPTASAGTNTTQLATTAFVTTAVSPKADIAGPTFTGVPAAPTASVNTNTTQIATTAFVVAQISDDAPTKTGTGASGSWGIDITGNAATATKLSTASGSAPSYSARAWVNFNGTGTVAIRASGNVSSITDNGTGDYTVNFTTAMPDADYCSNLTVSGNSGSYNSPMILESVAPTSSAIRFINMFDSNYSGFPEARDPAYCNVAIFR
jgi:hypothetical protein